MGQEYPILRLPDNGLKQLLHLIYQQIRLKFVSLPFYEHPRNDKDHQQWYKEVDSDLQPT